jgi:hypothetical protein
MGNNMVPVASSVATAALECDVRVNIDTLHKILSHVGKDATTKTAVSYGWIPTGAWEDCD